MKKITKQNIHSADNGRFYQVGEEFYPSATTILEAYPLQFGLKEFFLTNTKDEAERKLTEAGLSGSKIHHTIDLMLHGKVLTPGGFTQEDADYINLSEPQLVEYLKTPFTKSEDAKVRGFLQFWEDYKPEMKANELIVYSNKYKYAGTLDFIGYITIPATKKLKAKKIPVIMDWKTGKGLYDEYDLQLAAYWYAYREMNKGRKVNPFVAILQLGVNKTGYRLKIVKDRVEAFKNFLKIQDVWKMTNPDAKPENYEYLPEYKLTINKKQNEGANEKVSGVQKDAGEARAEKPHHQLGNERVVATLRQRKLKQGVSSPAVLQKK